MEKNGYGLKENTTGTGGSMRSCADKEAWLEMEDSIITPRETQKIGKKSLVLLSITPEEFHKE